MACDLPCMSYMALYVISMHLVNSSSRSSPSTSSQHWKLNLSAGKVEPAETNSDNGRGNNNRKTVSNQNVTPNVTFEQSLSGENNTTKKVEKNNGPQDHVYEDKMMQILHSKTSSDNGWIVVAPSSEDVHHHCSNEKFCSSQRFSQDDKHKQRQNSETATDAKPQRPLTCGKRVNSTAYDHLKGISERHLHSHIPEPDVATVFQSMGKSAEVDINDLEQRLRATRKEVEKSVPQQKENLVQIYNLIGNFWRIKGNTQTSIECFRKALSMSPNNGNVLLNLARVLLNLQYLEDAILLAWRSLKLYHQHEKEQSSSTSSTATSSPWLQHFTIGQALRAVAEQELKAEDLHLSQHAAQAAAHFQYTLTLNPNFAPAKLHLRELEAHGVKENGKGFGGMPPSSPDFTWDSNSAPEKDSKGATLSGDSHAGDLSSLPSFAHLTLFVLLSLTVGLLSGVFISLEAKGANVIDESASDSALGSRSTSQCSSASSTQSPQQRHFNRAMAMRSMKLGVNRKAYARSRKNNAAGL